MDRTLRVIVVTLIAASSAACQPEVEQHSAPLGSLRVGSLLGGVDDSGFRRADVPRAFEFPSDYGAHEAYRSEWWYLTMVLDDDLGREYGVQFTLFRQALGPPVAEKNPWLTNQAYLAHFAVSDVASNQHRAFERFARGHPELAGVTSEPFGLWLEDWRLATLAEQQQDETVKGKQRWRLSAGEVNNRLEAVVEVLEPLVLQGEDGLSAKSANQASYYYSMPRLAVSGSLTLEGRARTVTGTGWLDREWSTSVLSTGQLGWDWFALHLADGSDLMVFQLRRKDGQRDPYDQGMLITADGVQMPLRPEDFELQPLRLWEDGTGARWPVAWRVRVGDSSWEVRAAIDDQRMDTSIVYWEGLVHLFDEDGLRAGRGYMELTGYGDQ